MKNNGRFVARTDSSDPPRRKDYHMAQTFSILDISREILVHRFAGHVQSKVSAWPPLDTQVGYKEFFTKVGVKEASFALLPAAGGNIVTLEGYYSSEGRNVLATLTCLLPRDADEETVRQTCMRFFTRCMDAIDSSYARKLYLKSLARSL